MVLPGATGAVLAAPEIDPAAFSYLPVALAITLVHWWGTRALLGVAASGLLGALASGSGLAGILLALPELTAVALSWLLFTQLFRGRPALASTRDVTGFLVLGLALPLTARALAASVPAELGAFTGLLAAWSAWPFQMLGSVAVTTPLLVFGTPPLARRGWVRTGRDAPPAPATEPGQRPRGETFGFVLLALAGLLVFMCGAPNERVVPAGGLFVLVCALAYGIEAAVGAASAAMLAVQLAQLAPAAGLEITALGQADFGHAYLDLLVLALAGLLTGRTISDHRSELARRRATEQELRASEERFRRAVVEAPFPVMIHTEDGEVLELSRRWTEITGFTREEIPSVAEWIRRSYGNEQEWIRSTLGQLHRLDRRAEAGEFAITTQDGERRVWEISTAPAGRLRDGRRLVVTMAADVTARRVADRERRELEVQLRQSQKMEAVGRLAGGVAHDFNNLLTAVIAYSEMLLEDLAKDPGARDKVEQIQAAAERASALTAQLLAFSRRQHVRPGVLDLNRVVTELEPILRRLAGSEVELDLRLDPETARVKADRSQVEQVIVNLVVNARDAMPEGGTAVVETQAVPVDEPEARQIPGARAGAYVRLAVSDTGAGMDPETLPRIFEPFFTTKEPGKGTGLGLSTVYGITQQSGGFLRVESRVGSGSRFEVFLPYVVGEEKPPSPAAPVAPAGEGQTATILLVEDEAAVRRVAERALARSGFRVLAAENADEALALVRDRNHRIDLLLTDVIMPGMGGIELAEAVRAEIQNLRVVLMSGYSDREEVRPEGLAPRTFFLAKPFRPAELVEKVQEALR